MAILDLGWIGSRRYEVRAAGRTRRLIVDGVLHTEWNPSRDLTRGIWDPFVFGGFLAAPGAVRRVLVLGLGGGAAVHLVRRHLAPATIVAVEREASVVRLAKRWFNVAGPDLEIVTADAVDFLRRTDAKFDLIVDDVFGERSGEPLRAAGGTRWWSTLSARVADGGVFVVNFADRESLARSALLRDRALRSALRLRFPSALRFTFEAYQNAVVAFGPAGPHGAPISPGMLRARLRRSPTVGPTLGPRPSAFRLASLC